MSYLTDFLIRLLKHLKMDCAHLESEVCEISGPPNLLFCIDQNLVVSWLSSLSFSTGKAVRSSLPSSVTRCLRFIHHALVTVFHHYRPMRTETQQHSGAMFMFFHSVTYNAAPFLHQPSATALPTFFPLPSSFSYQLSHLIPQLETKRPSHSHNADSF